MSITNKLPLTFHRRDFIKLSSLSMFGLLLPRTNVLDLNEGSPLLGRVAYKKVFLYDQPNHDTTRVFQAWRDALLPIDRVVIGVGRPDYNHFWYRVSEIGYAHSGGIQPVSVEINEPVESIPKNGRLGEVSVPYTDARIEPSRRYPPIYRFYYETTHWIIDIRKDANGDFWYEVIDDKWDYTYFVLARHIRVIDASNLSPIAPDVPIEQKRVEVDTDRQLVTAFEYDKPVFMAKTATGAKFSNGVFYTPPGRHYAFHKRPARHMAAGNLAYNGYDLPGVPWVTYITEEGVAFHGTFWHNDFGKKRSHGCINLSSADARWIYRWTNPVVPVDEQFAYKSTGTQVDVI